MSFYFVLTAVLLILGGSNLYLARRFWQILTHFFPKLPFWIPLGVFVVLFAGLLTLLCARANEKVAV